MTRARDVANVLSTATSLATDTETAAAISSHNTAANGHVGRGTTANRPGSPATGDLYYDTTINNLIRYNGTSWIEISPIPNAPTSVSATAGDSLATVSFTAPTNTLISSYTATSSPGSITGSSTSSPITVSGLTNNTAYTFTVTATNVNGTSSASSASNSVTPIVPSDFESIATQIVSSNVSTVTFSNIPSTYTHLQVRVSSLTSAANNNIRMRFNSDTASNYSTHELAGSGTGTPSNFSTLTTGIYPSFSPGSTHPGAMIIDILDYKDTNKYKSVRSLWGHDTNGAGYVGFSSGSWRNSNVISSIVFDCTGASQTINNNSHFALYGIKV